MDMKKRLNEKKKKIEKKIIVIRCLMSHNNTTRLGRLQPKYLFFSFLLNEEIFQRVSSRVCCAAQKSGEKKVFTIDSNGLFLYRLRSDHSHSLDERCYETCFEVHNTFTCLCQSLHMALWK